MKFVSKRNWVRLVSNKEIVENIFPILFPTNKYLEILSELKISI